jgi:hypothetical protein
MASNGKRKTTMAKLAREGRLRERRAAKKARKDLRKLTPSEEFGPPSDSFIGDEAEDDVQVDTEAPIYAAAEPALSDA